MQCFYHPERSAVGVCRYCQRGLCPQCAVPVDDILACRGRHEELVLLGRHAEKRNVLQAQRTGAAYVRNAVFYGLAGVAFVALGSLQLRYLGLQAVFFVLIGLFLLYAAVANLLEARRFR